MEARERERELFARMDSWGDGNVFGIHEDMRFLRRRLKEARDELKRAQLHNIQLLRRKPKHSCIGGP